MGVVALAGGLYLAAGLYAASPALGDAGVFVGWLTPLLALGGLVLVARRDRALAAVLGLGSLVPIVLALGANTPLYEPLCIGRKDGDLEDAALRPFAQLGIKRRCPGPGRRRARRSATGRARPRTRRAPRARGRRSVATARAPACGRVLAPTP